jgi:N6-adenosine-specific RNA methylase IME4
MQVCLVGRKGSDPPGMRGGVGHDVIYSERRGQSQKPEEIYQLIEQLVPHGEQCIRIYFVRGRKLLSLGKKRV